MVDIEMYKNWQNPTLNPQTSRIIQSNSINNLSANLDKNLPLSSWFKFSSDCQSKSTYISGCGTSPVNNFLTGLSSTSCNNLHGNLDHRLQGDRETDCISRVGLGGSMILLRLVLQMLSRGLLKQHLHRFRTANNIADQSVKSTSFATAGFTLIELLVVIIIIGILAAISLPSFLSQANKARMAEAKSYIGSMNRTQHGYYLQFSQFASNVDTLGVGLSQGTTHYNYSIVSSGSYPLWKLATNFGQAKSGSLKSYAGVVAMVVTSQVYEVQVRSVMCVSGQPVAAPISGDYDTTNNFPTCPTQFLLDESQ
jgi:type IV pilus assembly protein PilA